LAEVCKGQGAPLGHSPKHKKTNFLNISLIFTINEGLAFLHFRYFNRLNPYIFELPLPLGATSVLTPLNREKSFITLTPGDLQICCKPKPTEATEGDLNKVSKRSSFLLISLKQFYFDAIEVHFCKTIGKLYFKLIK
jgi:hypothetical protein